MSNENGVWIMRGVDESDPICLHSAEDLILLINQIGFLPLFKNEIPGFSVEERTNPLDWWGDDPDRDPWLWRKTVASSRRAAYGKFFNKKAGFIGLNWVPRFANFRRNGYDFDVLWEDEKASYRMKRIMDLFQHENSLFSYEIKKKAGFGKTGEKNFEGTLSDLQMKFYLTLCDFRFRLNKYGLPYGWSIAVYDTPESVWGYDFVTGAYDEDPEESFSKILSHLSSYFPSYTEKLRTLLK